MPLSVDNWVLIASTLFLGVVALFVPTIAEWLQRRFYAPSLSIDFKLGPPHCHRTEQDLTFGDALFSREPVYYFRFSVTNNGRSQAKRCEAVLESVARADAAGNFIFHPRFTPVSLGWAGYEHFVDINPHRKFYCDLASVPSPGHQKALADNGSYVDWPGQPSPALGVVLPVGRIFYSQPNRLPPGRYHLDVTVYSENAPAVRRTFTCAWGGNWRDDETAMFQECVIS
jgi:hypothetical protein